MSDTSFSTYDAESESLDFESMNARWEADDEYFRENAKPHAESHAAEAPAESHATEAPAESQATEADDASKEAEFGGINTKISMSEMIEICKKYGYDDIPFSQRTLSRIMSLEALNNFGETAIPEVSSNTSKRPREETSL
jgi:hypothetical protein